MSIEYTEKRDFIRMKTDSKISFQAQGSNDVFEGECINLSANGVLFTSKQMFAPGTEIDINITPQYSVVQPLNATIEVIRSQVQNNGDFTIAGKIKEMH